MLLFLQKKTKLGRRIEINNDEIQVLVDENPQLTTREIADTLLIGHSSVIHRLHEMGYISRLNVWVPYDLTRRPASAAYRYMLFGASARKGTVVFSKNDHGRRKNGSFTKISREEYRGEVLLKLLKLPPKQAFIQKKKGYAVNMVGFDASYVLRTPSSERNDLY